MLHIPTILFDTLRGAALDAFPRECCGILLGRISEGHIHVEEIRTTENAAAVRQADRYEITPRDLLEADRYARTRDLDIVGFYHSHPNGSAIASATDAALSWEVYAYLIVAVDASGIRDVQAWQFPDQIPRALPIHVLA